MYPAEIRVELLVKELQYVAPKETKPTRYVSSSENYLANDGFYWDVPETTKFVIATRQESVIRRIRPSVQEVNRRVSRLYAVLCFSVRPQFELRRGTPGTVAPDGCAAVLPEDAQPITESLILRTVLVEIARTTTEIWYQSGKGSAI